MFNPLQEFTIRSINRMTIADMMNDRIATCPEFVAVPPFGMDDARLTSSVCEGIARVFGNISDDDLNEEERGEEERAEIDIAIRRIVNNG